jgi:hypothetical protein
MMKRRGRNLTEQQLAALAIPNTEFSLACYAWMDSWFRQIGDMMPNTTEIHLEPQEITGIWEEYKLDMEYRSLGYLEYAAFCGLWITCFSHVKIREFKAVNGKCATCALLSHARKSRRDPASRAHITLMHALHRTEYMGERLAYYARREMAMAFPLLYLSIISDGMAQVHCVLPYLANLKQFGNPLPQHLQGCYVHGQALTIYRTYHNVLGGANLQIHCFLLELERARLRNGYLAQTIFYQIDGGSENSAKVVVGLCELLVSRRLISRIVLTRLLVGHTHEDIDGKFALIWNKIKNCHVLTPSEYATAIALALKHKSLFVAIHDLFVVPDYTALLAPLLDGKFGRYAKMGWTHLQFEMEAVDVSEQFPLGVKTTWRQYSADKVVRIVKDEKAECGFADEHLEVKRFPEAEPEKGIVEGAYVLQSLPETGPVPDAFVPESRAVLEKVVVGMKEMYRCDRAVVDEWVDFASRIAPQSDDVNEYVAEVGLHVPFADVLFCGGALDANKIAIAKVAPQKMSARSRRAIAVDSVSWSHRYI